MFSINEFHHGRDQVKLLFLLVNLELMERSNLTIEVEVVYSYNLMRVQSGNR